MRIRLWCVSLGKTNVQKYRKMGRFSGRLQPDLGNTAKMAIFVCKVYIISYII